MTDPNRYESQDLEDYEVRDASETLDGDIGDDPLDTGVIPPQHWSAGMRYGTTAEEEDQGESLDQLLAEEEPDEGRDDVDDDVPESAGDDEDAGDEYVDGLLLDDGQDPRAGRLVAEDEGAHAVGEEDLVARDVGVDSGAATSEEAAVHVVEDDDNDVSSDS
jgi:hypothetical protein